MIAVAQSTPSRAAIARYSFLAMPLAFAGLPLYIYIPDFYTRDLGLGLASAGLILLCLRALDAIQDPLIGYFSDSFQSWRKTMMISGFVALLFGMAGVMYGPPNIVSIEIWFTLCIALTAGGLSLTGINLTMMGSLWHPDPKQTARISGWREAFGLIGMLLASATPALLIMKFARPESFQMYYWIFAVLLSLGFFFFLRFFKTLPAGHLIITAQPRHGITIIPLSFLKINSGFFLTCFLAHIAAALPASLFLYFVSDYLGFADKAGFFLFLYFLAGAVLMPFWIQLSGIISAEKTWLCSIILAISTFIWAYTLQPGDLIQFSIVCILSGFALGADLALPPAILARRIQIQNAAGYAAQAYAVLNVIPKIALAMASGLALITLDYADFSPGKDNSAESLSTLIFLYAVIPCLIKFLSGLMLLTLKQENGDYHENNERNSDYGHSHGT
jgi:Na+/melibiose symporter-like transporter